MKTSENQKSPREYKVYIHRLKTWVEVTEEQYYTYYRDIWATHKRAQAHGQCTTQRASLTFLLLLLTRYLSGSIRA